MTNIKIIKRPLIDDEINSLMNDIKLYPSLIYVKKSIFKKYTNAYILEENRRFAGICGIYETGDWVKLGPLVLLKKFHRKGYGKMLLNKIVNEYTKKHIFVVSSNNAVQKIMNKLNFKEVNGYFSLPPLVLFELIKRLFEYLHWRFILEFIRKKLTMERRPHKYFIKRAGVLFTQ